MAPDSFLVVVPRWRKFSPSESSKVLVLIAHADSVHMPIDVNNTNPKIQLLTFLLKALLHMSLLTPIKRNHVACFFMPRSRSLVSMVISYGLQERVE